jgi:hypothetical protein
VRESTDAERQRRREWMRRRRAEIRERTKDPGRIGAKARGRIAAAMAWSFESICEAVGLNPSPQSCLNPALWRDRINLMGCGRNGLKSKRKP